MSDQVNVSNADALRFHSEGQPGKLAIAPTKPLDTARDLSLAYSPGVAVPCLEIHRDPGPVFDYTSRGNIVAIVTGVTRSYADALSNVQRVLNARDGHIVFGMTMLVTGNHTLFVADSTINEAPSAEEIADITAQAAHKVRSFGLEPRVALMSFSNFGSRGAQQTAHLRGALDILQTRGVDFEVDGEMAPDTALDPEFLQYYPFTRLSGTANVLIMPNLHTANISHKLVEEMGGAHVIGPILLGLEKPVQIVRLGATVNDLLNMAALAALDLPD